MGRSRENKALDFLLYLYPFVTLEFLTSTFPCYKTEAKKLKEKTQEAVGPMFGNCNNFFLYRFTLPQISSLKYAPVTSCDVEESFSIFKNVL